MTGGGLTFMLTAVVGRILFSRLEDWGFQLLAGCQLDEAAPLVPTGCTLLPATWLLALSTSVRRRGSSKMAAAVPYWDSPEKQNQYDTFIYTYKEIHYKVLGHTRM